MELHSAAHNRQYTTRNGSHLFKKHLPNIQVTIGCYLLGNCAPYFAILHLCVSCICSTLSNDSGLPLRCKEYNKVCQIQLDSILKTRRDHLKQNSNIIQFETAGNSKSEKLSNYRM